MDEESFEDAMESGESHDGDKERAKRLANRMGKFLADIAEDFVDAETLAKIEKKVLRVMERDGVSPTVTNLHAFAAGFEFGMASFSRLEEESIKIAMGLKVMIKKRRKGMPEIDITKSKPLADGPEKVG